jgi:FkbM family methyltransferase
MDYVPFNSTEFARWISDRGDQTLRLTYNLDKNSTVIDAGGYLGAWANDISVLYDCRIFILEPLLSFHTQIADRFKNNSKVVPIYAALSNSTGLGKISLAGDSSSLFEESTEGETINCLDVKDLFEIYNIDRVDLMKINIEGSEYDLLERILELGLHNKVHNFQIQYHRFIEGCAERRQAIAKNMKEDLDVGHQDDEPAMLKKDVYRICKY